MLTRRAFLKLCASLPFWRFLPVAEQLAAAVQPETQPWGFPLAFPAYFPTTEQIEEMRRPHKIYLPLIQNG